MVFVMEISALDKSNYLKGLLITARKDKQLSQSEKEIIRSIATKLGFASDFYEDVLRNLMANKYISEEPIIFSDIKVAESFIADALKLVYTDEAYSSEEILWLKKTASENHLDENWFNSLKEELSGQKKSA